jgi:hypothetical protein
MAKTNSKTTTASAVGALVKSRKTKVRIAKTKPKEAQVDIRNINNLLRYDAPIKQVKPEDRPENVLDRAKDDHDAKWLTDIVEEFCEEGILEDITEHLKEQGLLTVYSYEDMAKPEEITLRDLQSALAVQRPINKRHLWKIQLSYNKNKVQVPIVLKIKIKGKWHYYIVDGQHTAATQGIRARLGLIKEVSKENWVDVKIRCSVIECQDFTFAREVFLGINGEDKLELAYFDKWKNYVLGARQDEADNELWNDCLELQEILEGYGITPIHKDSPDYIKRMPGAFVDVHLIEEKKPEDVRYFARLHQMCWDDKHVDPFEVDPMLLMRDKIRKDSSLDNLYVQKFFKELEALIRHTVGSPGGIKKLTQKTYPVWFKSTTPDEADKKISIPDDASLALLLFMYIEAGGEFEGLRVNLNFLKEKFTKHGETLFDYLSKDGSEVDADLKQLIRGSKDSE